MSIKNAIQVNRLRREARKILDLNGLSHVELTTGSYFVFHVSTKDTTPSIELPGNVSSVLSFLKSNGVTKTLKEILYHEIGHAIDFNIRGYDALHKDMVEMHCLYSGIVERCGDDVAAGQRELENLPLEATANRIAAGLIKEGGVYKV